MSAESQRTLALLGALRIERVELPRSSASLQIARPADYDRLIDEAAADPEQNLPYWAEIWPSGVALASHVLTWPDLVRGKRVLEIGCGVGVTAIAALRAGADLTVTDYAPEALALCSFNAIGQAECAPRGVRINWRDIERTWSELAGEAFPVVLAADVLYERRDIEPLLALTDRLVAPGGELWLAEPGRVPAILFVETMKTRGWSVATERCSGPWPDPEDNRKGVAVSIHRLRRMASG